VSTKKTMARLAKSKAHRAAYVSSQISIGIPYQVRALRKRAGWGQKRLAAESGMMQPRISAIENPGEGDLNLDTLKRLAAAFDVALIVRFAPFSELIRWSDRFSPDEFEVPSFGKDESLSEINNSLVTVGYLDLDTGTVTTLTDLTDEETISTAPQIPVPGPGASKVMTTAQTGG